MVINKLTASFGKLNGETLELHEGLNVIAAPNESGKSTWCAFIRAMLYGVDSSERQRSGHLPDKTRYAPWSGAPMQGEMELQCEGKSISIRRRTAIPTAPMREFSACYTGTSIKVEGLDGKNAGELLTGASKEVFRRSAFVEQGAIAVSGSPELEKRIASIVATGEDGASYTEADEVLRAWQRARRCNKRGMLPELDARISEAEQRLSELKSAAAERDAVERELKRSKNSCDELSDAIVESRKSARKDALSNLSSARKSLNACIDEHESCDAELDRRRSALEKSPLGDLEHESAAETADADLNKCRRLKREAEKRISPVLFILFLALAACAAALGLLWKPLCYGAAAVLALAAVFGIASFAKKKNAAAQAASERAKLLLRYGAENEEELSAAVEEFDILYAEYRAAEAAEHQSAKKLDAARKEQERVEAETLSGLDFSGGDNEASHLAHRYNAEKQRSEELSERLHRLSGRISTLGDPLVLSSELLSLRSERELIQREYDALSIAIDTLREADADIQSRFSPALGRKAAEYMKLMTGGSYDSLLINRDLSVLTRKSGDTLSRETEYLSAGTADLMYLAVRLAVCALALPENSNCPLILDDALTNLDTERSARAMELLAEIAKTRQVIVFTCKA